VTVSVVSSATLALALGLRHGLDADHLAAIDGLTRFNMLRRRRFAPFCGALFSAGHGGAIVLAATLLSGLASAWTPPVWLESTGKLFSAATLLLLGVSNLRLAVSPRSEAQPSLTSLRGGIFGATLRSSRAWQIMLIGALFAVSFDALGLAALFAATAAARGGHHGCEQWRVDGTSRAKVRSIQQAGRKRDDSGGCAHEYASRNGCGLFLPLVFFRSMAKSARAFRQSAGRGGRSLCVSIRQVGIFA
jgi:hypothetical protein